MRFLFLALVSICVLFIGMTAAQSGRRVAAPSPTPEPAVDETPRFSESAPQPKRPIYRKPARPKSTDKPRVQQTTQIEEDDSEVVKVETDLITVPVSVFDRNGLYIPDLSKSNFRIFEDGIEQEIAYFGTSEKPFTVVLLLDTSPSTEYKIEEIRNAAIAFVDQLKPADKVMVIEFDANVHVLTEATGDRTAIHRAINRADFGGGTSLYDAVRYALSKRLNAVEGRKAIVLFTDGVDTTSLKSDYDETIAMAEESDSMIFPIYYNTYFDNQRSLGGWGWPDRTVQRGTTSAEYALGRRYLEDLAAYTGGRIFRPESTPGGLTRAFEGIAEELRRQYNIGYIPKNTGEPGQRKQIKVRVDRPNLVLRARDSYIVGSK